MVVAEASYEGLTVNKEVFKLKYCHYCGLPLIRKMSEYKIKKQMIKKGYNSKEINSFLRKLRYKVRNHNENINPLRMEGRDDVILHDLTNQRWVLTFPVSLIKGIRRKTK